MVVNLVRSVDGQDCALCRIEDREDREVIQLAPVNADDDVAVWRAADVFAHSIANLAKHAAAIFDEFGFDFLQVDPFGKILLHGKDFVRMDCRIAE